MRIKEEYNYVILSNEINRLLLAKFSEYPMIDSDMNYNELKIKLEFHTSKVVVFNNTFYNLRDEEQKEIIDLLKRQNMHFILITSNIEEALLGDYIIVFDKKGIFLEGLKSEVLKEEKKLKKVGFGLPFVVDLSIQLNYYDIFKKVYFDMNELVNDLWN